MTPKEIAAKADALRKEGISMGNYSRVFNDCLVLVRELAKHCDTPDKEEPKK